MISIYYICFVVVVVVTNTTCLIRCQIEAHEIPRGKELDCTPVVIYNFEHHTGDSVKPFKCEYPNCMKNFSRNEELSRHRRIHSGYKPYLCHVCSKSFCRKDHLSKHLKTHLQISEKKTYVCCVPGCEHRYTRSDALTRHKSTAHSIQKTNTIPKNKK
ncbi:UNVERIFIED_CONTAM: Egr4 [Trichonephila clavipes]